MEEKTNLKKVFLVYFHGNFIPLQGVKYIIGAAKVLLPHEDIRIKIIGAGSGYDEIRALAIKLELKNIDFVGRLPVEQLPAHLLEADVCLGIFGATPKTQRVIPNKVYESIAMAKPAISADTPAMKELFTDRENILFCRHADPEDLAAKILELKNNEELKNKIARGGYELFQKRAAPRIVAKNLLSELEAYK
ncbi:glycosyltransferase [Candidatus Falkowbacteria bacterium]|nr:glycosyltransferase [Candidatus Falkowbacteria bacterium]